jgi:predicted dehydrogenase
MTTSSRPVRIAMIGAGAVSDYHHVPAIRFDPRATLVAACDTSQELLQQRRTDWNIQWTTNQFEEVCTSPDVDAVIIATPNFTHRAIAVLAAQNGKHIMCEKPLGLNADEVREMYYAARDHRWCT